MLSEFWRGAGSGNTVRVGPPNQHKLGGLSLTVSVVGYGGGDTHPPTRRNGTGDTDEPVQF
ncbi:MAG: hypothetical protein KME16_28410 [Scytolyngbya sp. HA4215-MV1]|nr:hypothetical protein [Scytolyngbya sp. HA4215-MV1]